MFRNYFKIALRNLQQQKTLTFINISGLSIGMACFSLFLLYAVNEFSYDRFNVNAAHIYRVVQWAEGSANREPGGEAYGGTPAGPAFKQDFPDVDKYARIQSGFDESFVRVGNSITRSRVSFADADLFNMFSFKLLKGNAAMALKDPSNIVLTKEKAIQLFGKADVVGQQVDIKIDTAFQTFTVGAVAENLPTTSSVQFDILGNFDFLMSTPMGRESANNWNMTIGTTTYVQLRETSTLMSDVSRLAKFRKKYYADEQPQTKKGKDKKAENPITVSFKLQPLREVHTDSRVEGGIDTKNIWILIAIAAGVLLIACINFTTLSIGRSAGRAKEVGMRKVMGGERKQLVMQFMMESVLLSLLSAIIAVVLANILLPYFSDLAGSQLRFSFKEFPELIWLLAGLTLLTGLLAGTYPAMVLSGFKPVEVLKSKIRLGGSNFFTKSLVTIQFVLSIALIISTLIILQQVKFMRSKNIGFNKENVVMVDVEGADTKKVYPLMKQALSQSTDIIGVSASEMGLGANSGLMGMGFEYNGERKGIIMYPVDADFLNVMGMQLIAGRQFNPLLASDSSTSIIVNEAFLTDYRLTLNEAIGFQLKEARGNGRPPRTVIGVIKDFNFSALKDAVRSQMFILPSSLEARKIYIRIKSGDPAPSLATINKAWAKTAPGLPFRYNFLDENFNRFYKVEQRWTNVVGSAGFISIFLACLGLFGLTALAAVNRTKEIGIRKVLGASVSVIVQLLSKDFLKLVAIAIVIAMPLAWYFMNKWLTNYQYRITINWVTFAMVALAAVFIALFTTGIQSVKSAMANPVKSLKME